MNSGKLLMLVILAGCAQQPPESPVTIPVAEAEPSAAPDPVGEPANEPRVKQFEGISLTVPAGWTEKAPASEFIQAEFQLPGSGGPARLTMSSTGGGIEANLERWRGQFTVGPNDPPPEQTTIPVDGAEAVVLELTGEFHDQFGGAGTRSDWGLLGAAIPTGPAHLFLKLTGPRETVAAHREAFRQMVAAARLDR